MFFKKKTNVKLIDKQNQQEIKAGSTNLSKSIDKNIEIFNELFRDDDTIIYRRFENQYSSHIKCCILFADGMINSEIVNENIIKPIVNSRAFESKNNLIDILYNQTLVSNNVEKTSNIQKLAVAIMDGDTVLLVDDSTEAFIIGSQGWQTREINEPETERVLRGPREGFTESLMINLSLVRRKLKTNDLKFKYRIMGIRSNTKICICYIQGIANLKILKELNKRLDSIEIDGILDSGYIQELIKDASFSPFETLGSTERPDIIAGKLLEGRIALFVDGSPVVLTLPYIFIEYFQSNDDYYINYFFSTVGRLVRILSFLLSISIPAIYISLVTFHQEMIPTPLIMNISAARDGVPLPTIVEAFGMLAVFEILRETGLRMPMFMGQALSIVGALVIGQAAIEAKLVSAPVVIITAFTGITGLMLPKLNGPIVLVRVIFILLSSVLGLYGYLFGMAGLLIHLLELRTFGIPYMYKLMHIDPIEEIKDTVIRAPWRFQKYRSNLIAINKVRNKSDRSNK